MQYSTPHPRTGSPTARHAWKEWLGRGSAALALAIALAGALVWPACTQPVLAPTLCPQHQSIESRPAWKVAYVLPDDTGEAQLAQSQALATGLLCDLLPGDTVIVVRESTFEVVVSAVVPGDIELLTKAGKCEEVPAGGPSQECLRVAEAEKDLDSWRMKAAGAIAGVASTGSAASQCSGGSGWPRDAVMQLLLSLQPDRGTSSYAWLLVSGDADARGNQPALGDLVATVHVVVAPFVLSCGDPTSLRDWFANARGIDLYPIERPASQFGAFLRSHATGSSLAKEGVQ